MKPIQIYVKVPLAAAVAAGRAEYGDGAVHLSEADLASLSDRARELVAQATVPYMRTDPHPDALRISLRRAQWGEVIQEGALAVTEATAAGVSAGLERVLAEYDRRVAKSAEQEAEEARRRAEQEAEVRARCAEWAALPVAMRASASGVLVCVPSGAAADYRGPLTRSGSSRYRREDLQRCEPEAWAEAAALAGQLEEIEQLGKAAKAEADREQIRAALAAHPEPLERYDAGVLSDAELDGLLAESLFAPFADLPRYEEIADQEVVDKCDCDPEAVTFSTRPYDGPLDATEWAALKRVRAAAPEGAVVEEREHLGYDRRHSDEDDPDVRARSVRVTIAFGGRSFRREFAL